MSTSRCFAWWISAWIAEFRAVGRNVTEKLDPEIDLGISSLLDIVLFKSDRLKKIFSN